MNSPFLKQLLPATRVIRGASGNYWQIAANEEATAEMFVRIKWENTPVSVGDGKMAVVDGLQVNVVYLGPEFEIPAPFGLLDTRPYLDGAKKVKGALVAKIWVPLGEFQKNLMEMYIYAKEHAASAVQTSLLPVIEAAGCKPTMALDAIFEFLINDLESHEKMLLEPTVYINQAWIDNVAAIKATAENWYEAAGEKANPKGPLDEA